MLGGGCGLGGGFGFVGGLAYVGAWKGGGEYCAAGAAYCMGGGSGRPCVFVLPHIPAGGP